MPNRFGEIRGAAVWFIPASALIAPPGCLGTRQRGSPHRLLAMRLFRLLSDDSITAGAAVVTRGLVRNQGKPGCNLIDRADFAARSRSLPG
jgi:hypothetical protein